jgi:diacylglycerol kinase family enzyme
MTTGLNPAERLVIVNPHAAGGQAAGRWAALAPRLQTRYPHVAVVTQDAEEAARAAATAASAGVKALVAAGGDGAVHALLNAVMDPLTDAPRWDVAIGAVGLGSSNDFHKPFDPARCVSRVPVAMDVERARRLDVGRADWRTPEGEARTAYFLLNSSLGATAKGNYRYNHPSGVLALLKGFSPALAIQWGTLEAVATFENVNVRLEVDDDVFEDVALGNMGVIKRVHFAGSMRYDTPVQPDDGRFDVNWCADQTRGEFVKAVLAIGQGRFLGQPKCHHMRASRVRVVPDVPTALELDGEVHTASEVTLRVVPRAIRVCG